MSLPNPDIRVAVQKYYTCIFLTKRDAMAILRVGDTVASRKIAEVRDIQRKENRVPFYSSYAVDTRLAYAHWGLDIADLEHRLSKMQKYGAV